MTQLIDCHSHSELSGHGSGTIEDFVRRADELGLHTYAQTEHLVLPPHLDPHYEVSMGSEVMDEYVDELHRMRDVLADEGSTMNLIVGIEADWLDDRAEELKELCEPFEYVLGSVHFIDEWSLDNPDSQDGWAERGVEYVWSRYFEVWKEMASSDAPFTAFSHVDLPKVFGDRVPFDATEDYHEMAALTADRDAMIEVNTAGWRKPAGEQYPCEEALRIFCEAGVDCTVGADAHYVADVACDVERAYDVMRRVGYTRVAVPMADGDRMYLEL
ncbi:MAG: histidinol-phosphatase [Coriobacteriaceae bacterium]|nr:histidinol-phosphatase [Coriobacteriaceae bacterium]